MKEPGPQKYTHMSTQRKLGIILIIILLISDDILAKRGGGGRSGSKSGGSGSKSRGGKSSSSKVARKAGKNIGGSFDLDLDFEDNNETTKKFKWIPLKIGGLVFVGVCFIGIIACCCCACFY